MITDKAPSRTFGTVLFCLVGIQLTVMLRDAIWLKSIPSVTWNETVREPVLVEKNVTDLNAARYADRESTPVNVKIPVLASHTLVIVAVLTKLRTSAPFKKPLFMLIVAEVSVVSSGSVTARVCVIAFALEL